jgi:iron complex outermembrane receptor protein
VLHNEQQIRPGAAFIDVKGRADQPIEWRGRGSIAANWHGANVTLFMNYVGSYDNLNATDPTTNAAIGTVRVKPWTTFDLNIGYSGQIPNAFLKTFRASVNVQNITDKDPPRVITATGAFNASYSNPFGRTVTAQLSVNF